MSPKRARSVASPRLGEQEYLAEVRVESEIGGVGYGARHWWRDPDDGWQDPDGWWRDPEDWGVGGEVAVGGGWGWV